MPRNSRQLSFATFPTLRQKLLHDVLKSNAHCIMSYDPVKMELVPHYWPVREFTRVPPSELRQYRSAHQYQGPGCLCPLLAPLSQKRVFIEAAIYLTLLGPYEGEYVVQCAKSRCGYLVPLERVYTNHGIPVKDYPLRGDTTPCPAPVYHELEMDPQVRRPLKRTYAVADLSNPSTAAFDFEGEDLSRRTDWRKFIKLDSLKRPGLTEDEFRGLFVKCDVCALITTHLVFDNHHCQAKTEDISEDLIEEE